MSQSDSPAHTDTPFPSPALPKHQYICKNGVIIPRDEASIAIDDRGFRFGDGVFETILVRDGVPYLWAQHINRLHAGLDALMIGHNVSYIDSLRDDITALINKNFDDRNEKNCILRITISRGAGSVGYMPQKDIKPTVIIETTDAPSRDDLPDEIILHLSDYHRPPPECYPTEYKLNQGVSSTLARMQAKAEGCFDALQLSTKGKVAECSSYNIFWMCGKTLYTPDLRTGCLDGVMRSRVIEQSPYKTKLCHFSLKHLLGADAVIATNCAHLVIPIHGLQGAKTKWDHSNKLADKMLMMIEQDIANNISD